MLEHLLDHSTPCGMKDKFIIFVGAYKEMSMHLSEGDLIFWQRLNCWLGITKEERLNQHVDLGLDLLLIKRWWRGRGQLFDRVSFCSRSVYSGGRLSANYTWTEFVHFHAIWCWYLATWPANCGHCHNIEKKSSIPTEGKLDQNFKAHWGRGWSS